MAFEIVAVAPAAEAQFTAVVRSCVEASEKVPVATKFSVDPFGSLAVAGVMAIETSVAAVTVRAVAVLVTVTPPMTTLAVMFVGAAACALPNASPFAAGSFEIVAVACTDEAQFAVSVRSCVVVSSKKPVAVNCTDVPFAIEAVGCGLRTIATSFAAVTISMVLPEMVFATVVPCEAVTLTVPAATPEATPSSPGWLSNVAMVAVSDAQVTLDVMSCMAPSS